MKPYFEQDGIQIYHGDFRELLPRLPWGLILTDPPYGIGLDYGAGYEDTFENALILVKELIKIQLTRSTMLAFSVGTYDMEIALYRLDPPPTWRICWYKDPQSTYTPIGWKDWEVVPVYGGDNPWRRAHDYFHCHPDISNSVNHPCPKPLGFYTKLISLLALEGDIIIDSFMGSGTSLEAARFMGHKAIGIDINERYCEVAAKRLEQGMLDFPASAAPSNGHLNTDDFF
jgi:DNA modification methylase